MEKEVGFFESGRFPDGPWTGEPDWVKWEYLGFKCLIYRSPTGTLNGYVDLPKGHPWFGMNYDDIKGVDVHGGLTYSAHPWVPPEASNPEEWRIGFDTAHAGDLVPMIRKFSDKVFDFEEYRDLAFVTEEVLGLALQALDATRKKP